MKRVWIIGCVVALGAGGCGSTDPAAVCDELRELTGIAATESLTVGGPSESRTEFRERLESIAEEAEGTVSEIEEPAQTMLREFRDDNPDGVGAAATALDQACEDVGD